MGCVYQAKNKINGKLYVGFTLDLENRKKSHKRDAENGSMLAFHCAIRKYGWDAFEWTILYEDDDNDREWLGWWEQKFIRKLNTKSPNGYNLTDGGDGVTNPTLESRKKLSEALSGRKLSKEHRDNIGFGGKGKKHKSPSEQGRKNQSEAQKKISPEVKKIRVESWKKTWDIKPEEEKAASAKKRSDSLMGHSVTEETRAKIRESLAGHVVSEETRQKIRNTLLANRKGC